MSSVENVVPNSAKAEDKAVPLLSREIKYDRDSTRGSQP
jgi:hypothetical protein